MRARSPPSRYRTHERNDADVDSRRELQAGGGPMTRRLMANRRRGAGALAASAAMLAAGAAWAVGAGPAVAADACPNAEFRTGPSANLPDCRAYEQVTPVNKHGARVALPGSRAAYTGHASLDGSTVNFMTSFATADEVARGHNAFVRATRTAAGWHTASTAWGPALDSPISAQWSVMRSLIPSADGSKAVFASSNAYSDDYPFDEPKGNGGIVLADGKQSTWMSKPTWAGSIPAPGTTDLTMMDFLPISATPDLSTVYFTSRARLTLADSVSPRPAVSHMDLYRWSDGVLENAGILPDGSLDAQGSGAAGVVTKNGLSLSSALPVFYVEAQYHYMQPSPDGREMLFASPNPSPANGETLARPAQLYLSRQGEASEYVSKRVSDSEPLAGSLGIERVGAVTGDNSNDNDWSSVYAAPSGDYDVILFATRDVLIPGDPDEATIKTYRLDRTAAPEDALTRIADLDRASAQNPAVGAGGVVGVSHDGSRMLYRTADGVLRLWREGEATRTVATGVPQRSLNDVRFTPDGRTWVLQSRDPLNGEPDHPVSGTPSQIYRYSEGSGFACISCPRPDAAVQHGAVINISGHYGSTSSTPGLGGDAAGDSMGQVRGMSEDGRSVFFTSISTLTGDDHNAVQDVYQWKDGELTLLSSGSPVSQGEAYVDSSPDGSVVFMTSNLPLVEGDSDDVYDLYALRVNGGLPAPVGPAPACVGDACQGEASPPPALVSPKVASSGPQTNRVVRVAPRLRVRKRAVRAASVIVAIRVSRPGLVRVSGRRVWSVRRSVSGAKRVKVRVPLRRGAVAALQRRGRLKVPIVVRFRDRSGATVKRRMSLTIKRAQRAQGRGR